MKAQTLFAVLSFAALQQSFAALSWVPVGPPTVDGNFEDASLAASGGWDETPGTYTHVNAPGAQGSTGYMLVKDVNGLNTAIGAYTYSKEGRTSVYPGNYAVLTTIYLDTSWPDGSGFDYSVSPNNVGGTPLRDFATSIGFSGGNFYFAASNNVDLDAIGAFNSAKNPVNLGALSSGWYDFQTVFYDDGGFLSADLNMLNSSGTVLATKTISATDPMANVGGHRYAWMTGISNNNDNQLRIDSYSVQNIQIPEPGVSLLGGLAGFMLMRRCRA